MLLALKAAKPVGNHSWVKNWTSWLGNRPGQLHALGEIELQNLGERYRQLFPDLLGETYVVSYYTFVSTQVNSFMWDRSTFCLLRVIIN